ncbi:MAG: MAE_28990/MAE_18760 family HEPN-like nuclease [Candidatus Anammoxibacter sp.]
MDNTKQGFEISKAEINNYFGFLEIFDNDDTKLQYKKEGKDIIERIQPQFQIVLIANAFLILYNLIESTIRNSIKEMYTKINDDEVRYEGLSENLKKIWIKEITENLKEDNYRPETLHDYIFCLVKDILDGETIILSEENVSFSGNLDAEKIRCLAEQIGFDISPNGNGRNLVKIKDKRNRLAHGEQTFYEVGKDFTVKELCDFKDETFKYLSDVINKIEIFISNKKYTTN